MKGARPSIHNPEGQPIRRIKRRIGFPVSVDTTLQHMQPLSHTVEQGPPLNHAKATSRNRSAFKAVELLQRPHCQAAYAPHSCVCPVLGWARKGLAGQPAHSYAPHHFDPSWPVDCRSTACWELLAQQLPHNCTLQQTTTTAQGTEASANTAAALAQRPKQAIQKASMHNASLTCAHVRHDNNSHKQQHPSIICILPQPRYVP